MWYTKQGNEPNYKYMTEALKQSGNLPQGITNIDREVYSKLMHGKVATYNDNAIGSIRRGMLSFLIDTETEYYKMKNLTARMLLDSIERFETNTRARVVQSSQANYTSISREDLLSQIVDDTRKAMKTMSPHGSLAFAYKKAITDDEIALVKKRIIKDALSALGYEGKNALPRYVAKELSKTEDRRHGIGTHQKRRDNEEYSR